jgi:hypothetical protein
MPELSPFVVYLIMQADTLIYATNGLLTLAFIIALGSFVCWMGHASDARSSHGSAHDAYVARACKRLFAGALVSVFMLSAVMMFAPKTNTLIAMYAIPPVVEMAQGLPLDDTARKTVEAVNRMLDKVGE